MACDCLEEINRGFARHNGHILTLQDGETRELVPRLKVVRLDRSKPAPQPRMRFCPWCGLAYSTPRMVLAEAIAEGPPK